MNPYGVIYCLTSPSGKKYFGKTTNWKTRIRDYKRYKCSGQPKIHRALLKYGSENFVMEVVSECESKEELNFMEAWFISLHETIREGYNCREGGEGGKHSEEAKRKISAANRGKSSWCKGKKMSQDFCDAISERVSGQKHSNFDFTIRCFYNIYSHVSFYGHQYTLCEKYGLNRRKISMLIHGGRDCVRGWRLMKNEDEISKEIESGKYYKKPPPEKLPKILEKPILPVLVDDRKNYIIVGSKKVFFHSKVKNT